MDTISFCQKDSKDDFNKAEKEIEKNNSQREALERELDQTTKNNKELQKNIEDIERKIQQINNSRREIEYYNYYGIGNYNLREKNYTYAIDNYSNALTINRTGEALYYRGRSYHMIGKNIDALNDLNEVISRNQDNDDNKFAEIHQLRGAIKQSLDDIDGAMRDFDEAKRLRNLSGEK